MARTPMPNRCKICLEKFPDNRIPRHWKLCPSCRIAFGKGAAFATYAAFSLGIIAALIKYAAAHL